MTVGVVPFDKTDILHGVRKLLVELEFGSHSVFKLCHGEDDVHSIDLFGVKPGVFRVCHILCRIQEREKVTVNKLLFTDCILFAAHRGVAQTAELS